MTLLSSCWISGSTRNCTTESGKFSSTAGTSSRSHHALPFLRNRILEMTPLWVEVGITGMFTYTSNEIITVSSPLGLHLTFSAKANGTSRTPGGLQTEQFVKCAKKCHNVTSIGTFGIPLKEGAREHWFFMGLLPAIISDFFMICR